MELTLKSTTQRVHKKVERDFQWYNPYTKKVWKDRGGEMIFRYDAKLKYSVPHVVDAKDWVMQNNFEDIVKWVKHHDFSVLNSARNFFVTVEIPDGQLDDISEELYNKKIIFDWE